MNISIVTPLYASDDFRKRNWEVVYNHLAPLVKELGIEWLIPEFGSDEGNREHCARIACDAPFNRSTLRNVGWRNASHDQICFLDADTLMHPDVWRHSFLDCQRHEVFSPHVKGVAMGPQKTANRIKGNVFQWNPPVSVPARDWAFCGGVCFFKRHVLESVDGWDERFCGWGSEDTAMEHLVRMRFDCRSVRNYAFHLWHPIPQSKPSERRFTKYLYRTEYVNRSFDEIMKTRRNQRQCIEEASRQAASPPRLTSRTVKGLVAVTSLSLSPDKLERQMHCLGTWRQLGLRTISLQLPGESQQIAKHFPDVEFREVQRHHHKHRRVLIVDHAGVATREQTPVMLINSDIEIWQDQERFIQQWVNCPDDTLQIGIRWNYNTDIAACKKERWGIDAFRFTPKMAEELPDLGFGIGLPVWDYWLPYHYCQDGYRVRFDASPALFHRSHPLNWSKQDSAWGMNRLACRYGSKGREVDDFVQRITDRRTKPDKRGRIAIGCSRRTGSNMLLASLARHPSAKNGGEPLCPHCPTYQRKSGQRGYVTRNNIFKLHSERRNHLVYQEILDSCTVIFLYRRDTKAQLDSWRLASQTGEWSAEQKCPIKMEFPEDAEASIERDRKEFEPMASLSVCYEDMIENWNETIRKILNVAGWTQKKLPMALQPMPK